MWTLLSTGSGWKAATRDLGGPRNRLDTDGRALLTCWPPRE
jgi:hypothetical protein